MRVSSPMEKIKAFLQVSRANLLLTSFGHATLGMLVGASVYMDLFQMPVLFFIILHYCIAFFACNINCYFDYHIDRHYKTNLSKSVDIVSKKWLRLIMVVEVIIALILAAWFFFHGYVIVMVLSFLGLFAGYAYSAEPVRFKKRGMLGPVMILFLYSLPILGGWFIFQTQLHLIIIVFLFGYILMNEGFTLVNMCEDFLEDKKEGIITWAHHLGIRNTIRIAVVFSFSGLLCVFSLLFKINIIQFNIIEFIILVMFIVTTLLVVKAGWEVYEILRFDDLLLATKSYGKRLQRWFLMTRFPLIVTAFLLLI